MNELNKILGENKVLNLTFFDDIKQIIDQKGVNYIDAVIYYCEKNNIEIETVAAVIKSNPKLKACIQIEAEDLNMMKEKHSRLPT